MTNFKSVFNQSLYQNETFRQFDANQKESKVRHEPTFKVDLKVNA